MANKKGWMEKLSELDGAVNGNIDIHANGVASHSPSLNYCFGNNHLCPAGHTLALYGPEKCGKSLITNDMAGWLHQTDKEAFVVKFNSEFRERGQVTRRDMQAFGIDHNRYQAYEVNTPDMIFDRIEKEIAAYCQDGMPLKMVIIDSINSIQGRRSMNADTIMTQQIGDMALTLQDGFKRILPVQRKYGFSVVLVAQARDEMDELEKKRGKKYKMAAARAVRHYAEYFMCVEKFENKGGEGKLGGKSDLLGKDFEDTANEDIMGNAEKTAHKIKVTMIDSSLGPKGRSGLLTLGYENGHITGFINQHEEAFLLGVGRNVIVKPNQVTYSYHGQTWRGKEEMITALRDNKVLYSEVIKDIKAVDIAKGGDYADESSVTDNVVDLIQEPDKV